MKFTFEAQLKSISHTGGGTRISMLIHPNDVPDDMDRHLINESFECFLELATTEEPDIEIPITDMVVESVTDVTPEKDYVKHSVMLCKDPEFQEYVCNDYESCGITCALQFGSEYRASPEGQRNSVSFEEYLAIHYVQESCNIDSRKELKHKQDAQLAFLEIFEQFNTRRRHGLQLEEGESRYGL